MLTRLRWRKICEEEEEKEDKEEERGFCYLSVYEKEISEHNIFWTFHDRINKLILIRKWDNPTIYKLDGEHAKIATVIAEKDFHKYFLLVPHDAIMLEASHELHYMCCVSYYNPKKPSILIKNYENRQEKIKYIREREQRREWIFIEENNVAC
jgi:hypothetical protein